MMRLQATLHTEAPEISLRFVYDLSETIDRLACIGAILRPDLLCASYAQKFSR
jgi:hypothetical protein